MHTPAQLSLGTRVLAGGEGARQRAGLDLCQGLLTALDLGRWFRKAFGQVCPAPHHSFFSFLSF